MSVSSASVQMDDIRRRAQSALSLSGSAQDVKADVQTMANLPLQPPEKYRHLGVEAMLRENTDHATRQEVKWAFSILKHKLHCVQLCQGSKNYMHSCIKCFFFFFFPLK